MLPKVAANRKTCKPQVQHKKKATTDNTDKTTTPKHELDQDDLPTTKHGCKIKAPPAPDSSNTVSALTESSHGVKRTLMITTNCTQAAKDQSCRWLVSKTPKSYFHEKIAWHVFSVDEDPVVHEDYKRNPACYIKSVDTV